MTPAIAILGALLVATILTAPIGVYEYRKGDVQNKVHERAMSIPNPTPIPIHIPMVAMTTATTYAVPYWLGGFAVTTPSSSVWTLPLTYNNGGKVQPGEFLQIRNYGPGNITLQTTSPETIEFGSSYVIVSGAVVKILSNSPNWVVTAPFGAGNVTCGAGLICAGTQAALAPYGTASTCAWANVVTDAYGRSTCTANSAPVQSVAVTAPLTLGGTSTAPVLGISNYLAAGVGTYITGGNTVNTYVTNVKDYGAVCNGVNDDTTALQAAFASLANNSLLFFPAGNCVTGKLAIPTGRSGVKVYGSGPASIITRKPGTPGASGVPFISINTCTDCEISDLQIINDPAMSPPSSIYGDQGIAVLNSVRVTVSRVRISLGLVSGVVVISSVNTSVTDSLIYGYALSASNPPYSNIGGYGIGILDNSVGSVVSRNQITSGAVGIGLQQISASGDGISDSVITDNIISDQNSYGIMLYSFGGGVREIYRTVIGGNYITRIYGSMNNTATSSKSFGAGIYLLTVHDVSVVNNVIAYTNLQTDSQTLAPAAIGVSQGRSVSITGNTLRQYPGGYPGVYMVTSGTSDVSGSRSITGNSMENCGISLNSMRDVSITGNSIKNSGTFGVTLTNSSFISVEANRISSLVAGGFKGGILVDSASASNTLLGNHIEVVVSLIVCISDSGARTLITGNYLSGSTRAIQTLGSGAVVTNNYCFGATNCYVLSTVPSYVANNVGFPASSSSTSYLSFSPFSQTLGGTTTVAVNGIQYGLVDCAAGTRVITNLGGGVAGQTVTLAATNGVGANFTATGVTTKPFVYITADSGQSVTFLRLDTAPVATWVLISTTV